MNTIKKIGLSTIILSSLLFANSSFADGHGKRYKEECNYKKGCKSKSKCGGDEFKKYKKCAKKSGKHHKGSKGRFIIGAVYSLDLTKEQEAKIDAIMKKFQEQRVKTYNAFKDGEFDKQAYIDARLNKKENDIKAKAELIEDVYEVLTKEQKEKLKKELESFEKRKK